MKKNYALKFVALLFLVSSHAFSQVDVTFKVDMSAETVSADGVHVVGSINEWNTTINPLIQEGSSNIYSATLALNPGWYEYKFLNGNAWGTDEAPSAPCAASNGNRFLYINDSGVNVTLVEVPFSDCNSDNTGFSVTFNVDMSSEGSISSDGVHLAGSFNGWATDSFEVSDVSGDIHSTTLRLATPADYPIVFEYKYLNGNAWGTDETPDAECATVVNNNRLVTVSNSGNDVNDIFNGCVTLGLEDIDNAKPIKLVYSQNQRLLKFYGNDFNTISKIQVVDINGRIIKNLEPTGSFNDIQIDFHTNANGLYFVQIISQDKQIVEKIIVY